MGTDWSRHIPLLTPCNVIDSQYNRTSHESLLYYYIIVNTTQVISRSGTLNERACKARTVTIYTYYMIHAYTLSASVGSASCQTIIQSHDTHPKFSLTPTCLAENKMLTPFWFYRKASTKYLGPTANNTFYILYIIWQSDSLMKLLPAELVHYIAIAPICTICRK